MSQDNYGNEIPAAVQHTDEEYAYPPVGWKAVATERKICAQDERFASQNKAIGLLQCKLEQHIAQCADGLAPLADFISASWAVIDELVTRIEQLEAAQPIPTIARAATIDENGVLVSHDAWDVMHLELAKLRTERDAAQAELRAERDKWASAPLVAIRLCAYLVSQYGYTFQNSDKAEATAAEVLSWLKALAPRSEAAE